VKTFALPVPPTPDQNTTDPSLGAKYTSPIALTSTGAASGLQVLSDDVLLASRSSMTSPNQAFLISGLNALRSEVQQSDTVAEFKGDVKRLTDFAKSYLKDKVMNPGEQFWFRGAEDKNVQGWIIKPPGFKAGEKKKWPVVLIIHGGMDGSCFSKRRFLIIPRSLSRSSRRSRGQLVYSLESRRYIPSLV